MDAHFRPLLVRHEAGAADFVAYGPGAVDDDHPHLADFPWRVGSYQAYLDAVDDQPLCRLFRRGDALAHTARRVRDLTAVIRSSRASVDKVHHVVDVHGEVVQHAFGNLQVVDGMYSQAKGSLQTALEMDLYVYIAVVVDVLAPLLPAQRVANILAAAQQLLQGIVDRR